MTIPIGMSRYHKLYIKWLKESIQKLNINHVFMHVPTTEYHNYIKEFENQIKKPLPQIHESLDNFGQEVVKSMREVLEQTKIKYTFLNPMTDFNVSDPIQSYRFPYNELLDKYPDQEFFALEDLNEYKLVSDSRVKNGIFAVLDHPDPYLDKKTDDNNSSLILF